MYIFSSKKYAFKKAFLLLLINLFIINLEYAQHY